MKRAMRSVILWIIVFLIICSAIVVAVKHHNKQHAIAEVKATHQLSYSGKTGSSVLVLLKQKAASVVTDHESGGVFVQNIDGLQNGADNKTWTLYVNGKLIASSPAEYNTKQGDEIVWKFQ